MAFKVGDAVRLKSGGAQMTVSKLFKSPEGREMVQCTWFENKPRKHRAAFAHFGHLRKMLASSRVRIAPWGHRLGLVSLMDGTVPPLPFQLPPLSSSRPKQPG